MQKKKQYGEKKSERDAKGGQEEEGTNDKEKKIQRGKERRCTHTVIPVQHTLIPT